MGYSFKQKVLRWICRVFGHKPTEKWTFEKRVYHSCGRCKEVYEEEILPVLDGC